MKEGDYLVGIGDADVKWSSHAEVMTRLEPVDYKLYTGLLWLLCNVHTLYRTWRVLGMRLYLFASASLRFFQEIFASHVFASFFLPTCSHILTVVVTSAKFSVWSKNASAIYVHVVVASAGLLRRAVFASFLELSRMASKKCTPRFRWREDTK